MLPGLVELWFLVATDVLFPLWVRCEAAYCLNRMKRGCSHPINKMLLIRLHPAESYLTATSREQRLLTEASERVHTSVSIDDFQYETG